ncbi:MAG TPA: hypothetical protein V6C52_06780 [Coleofasciculaceae cyanobacterium]|jgi:hypothetical protein
MTTIAPLEPGTRLAMAEQFFLGALTSRSLAHAYILKGKSCGAMYNLALKIAQIVNCRNRPEIQPGEGVGLANLACGQCTDCRWIAQNSHPAVLTVSRMTYQVNDKDHPELLSTDELEKLAKKSSWPTMIKTGQIGHLIYQLSLSSEHTRVVIFTDAEELPASFPSEVPAPGDWRSLEATEDRTFHIRPLDRQLFNANSVNRFLKTLEEPPPNTLFFYIAETEEQLLDTIVSRCQVVPCMAERRAGDSLDAFPPEYLSFIAEFTQKLRQGRDVYALTGEFEAFFVAQGGLSHMQALEVFQAFLRRQFLEQSPDEAAFTQYRASQHALDTAYRMLDSKTNEGQALLNLFLTLSK